MQIVTDLSEKYGAQTTRRVTCATSTSLLYSHLQEETQKEKRVATMHVTVKRTDSITTHRECNCRTSQYESL